MRSFSENDPNYDRNPKYDRENLVWTQLVIADHQLPPVVHLLSEPCLRAEPGKILALGVGVCALGGAETAKGR